MEPTPQIDSSSSNPAKLEAKSSGHKRKKFVSQGDDSGTTFFSANSHTPVGKKLQRISEASGVCSFLNGLDRGQFGSVTKDIEGLQVLKKSYMLRLYSKMDSLIPFNPLENVKKSRLANQKITSVPQCAVVNLEDVHPQGQVIEADKPVIILDLDEEEDTVHSKEAMNGPDHKLLTRDSTEKNCQIIKDEARSSPANYAVQLDRCRDADTKNDIQVKDSGKVNASNDFVRGSLYECNVQVHESSYPGMENIKDSMDENAALIGKCNIQVDVSSNAVIENNWSMKEDNHPIRAEGDAFQETEIKHNVGDSHVKHDVQVSESSYSGMEKHMVDGLTKIDSDFNNLEDDRSQCHAIAADVPMIILDSDEEDRGYQRPLHKFSMEKITVKHCQVVKAPEDEARSSPTNGCVQISRRGYTDSKVVTSRRVVGCSPAECNIQVDESPYPASRCDIQVVDTETIKKSRDVCRDLLGTCNGLIDLSSDDGMDNEMAIKEENTENDAQIRNNEKIEVSRDVVADLPAKCSNQVDESACAGMENLLLVKDDYLVKIDAKDDIQHGDRNMVEASMDFIGNSPDKCIIQVDGNTHSGMKNHLERKKENQEIDAEDDILTEFDTVDDSQDTQSKKVKALNDVLAGSKVAENTYSYVENDMNMEEDDRQIDVEDDDLADIWKEMTFALECSKDATADHATYEYIQEDAEKCDHSFILKDDLGYVCRICGIIQRSIDTIFDFQYSKRLSTRTYAYESRDSKGEVFVDVISVGNQSPDLTMTQIAAHPRHRKEMKPHQVQGFNFLCSNLVTDNPGGCILAHAPGSGKTFMIISFIQSFLAKYPNARPLVVLPKGILASWRKEFQIWQVEDIPLHDLYTSKAENRSQQLDVLKRWIKQKSILFLGYKQLSVMVCDGSSKEAAECQKILIKVPTILILDEGHTPRNDETDMLQSLSKIETPRKVILSGTLYQNHVKEVFNILQLVHPQFLKLKASRMIVNRIMSRVQISKVRKHLKCGTDSNFFDLVEYALQDEDFRRKKAVIQDLRQMTSKVLHYYRGDFLDVLPGLVDFTVVLNLSARQKDEVQKLRKLDKFRRTSLGSAVYMHPELKNLSRLCSATGEKGSSVDDKKIEDMLKYLDVKEGVKTKFFLNILRLCESAGEKLLVFSQYILPLKLLERLSAIIFGWSLGKELFMITGDANTEQRERCMEQFNGSPGAKVFFGSIKACGEGISLVGASRIIILDVHLNPSVSRQAIGRAFRPGQTKKVYTYRLVAADSPEQEDYLTCSRKELISKMWFEWNESCGDQDFEVKTVNVNECGDTFFESPGLREDLNVLYMR